MKEIIRIAYDAGTREERQRITPVRIFLTMDGKVYSAGRVVLGGTERQIRDDLDRIEDALRLPPVSLRLMQEAGIPTGGLRPEAGRPPKSGATWE